ncbi:MAG: Hsp70 family protein, partial [Blastocatellia bacterium]
MTNAINYGIDLGTTNSAIAKCEDDDVRIFKNRDQKDVTPSAVMISRNGRKVIGQKAFSSMLVEPDNVATEFKRWMGQSDCKRFTSSGINLSAEELSAEVLKSLLDDARRQTTDKIDTAVITVPAAFGQLQCEATARASQLAGLINAPLLQEPLAASIAYGIKADYHNKRWLVYDLGGGTFDIALVSTRNGKLSVLQHQGDNMLGGKDIDRQIVRSIIWPRLTEVFNLPNSIPNNGKLTQILYRKAEEAKIDLSFSEQAIVSISEVGEDEDGNYIEAEFEITRLELDKIVVPIVDKTIKLCKKAMEQARMAVSDLSEIILVGGPSYIPVLRDMLISEFGIKLNYSIDPMTVVARGAAIYASTLNTERDIIKTQPSGSINLELAYEKVWADTSCLVAGKIDRLSGNYEIEVFIESDTGHWNSGWLLTNQEGYFESVVHLLQGRTNNFIISLRDSRGRKVTSNINEFKIRHGLTLAEIPLPHSIGAEIVNKENKSEIDPIFERSTPLPAVKILTYKASKTLKPSQQEDYLAIKIWEGERFSDPESNTFVGALKIMASQIKRPIPEGADIEIAISINTSRLMDVEAYIPLLDEHFRKDIYIPKDNQESSVEKAKDLGSTLNNEYSRINYLEELTQEVEDKDIPVKLEQLRSNLEDLDVEQYQLNEQDNKDPDDAKRVVEKVKEIRGAISEIERHLETNSKLPILIRKSEKEKVRASEVVEKWGEKFEKQEYDFLVREVDRSIA